MSEPINLRVPKSMPADDVVWAFRYGVTMAMYSRGTFLPKRGISAYVQAPRNVLMLSNRVRRAWLQRHPRTIEPGGETR